MGLEMIDRDQRLVVDQRDGLGGGQPDDHAADQAGTGRGGDAVKLVIAASGFLHCAGNNSVNHLDMGAGGYFRHHTAKGGVLIDLRQHDVRQNAAAAVLPPFHDGGGCFVAGRFNTEDEHL
jgi:hypothetical protein